MEFLFDYSTLENIFRFYIPLLIIISLALGYLINNKFLEKFSINSQILFILLVCGVIGSFINIPIYKEEGLVLFINIGGIIIPIIISVIYIYKFRENFIIILLSIIMVTIVTFSFAKVVPGFGIVIDFPYYFIPIIFGTLTPFFVLTHKRLFEVIPVTYSSITIGVFIGTDILLLPTILENNIRIGYFGGLGIFDFIFISGLYSIAISFLIIFIFHLKNKGITNNSKD